MSAAAVAAVEVPSLRDLRDRLERRLKTANTRTRFAEIEGIAETLANHPASARRRAAHYWQLLRFAWMDSDMAAQQVEEDALADAWHGPDDWWLAGCDDDDLIGMRGLVMTRAERRALAAMPAILTIYRGCIRNLNERGWSWTLDRRVAEHFADMANSIRMRMFGGATGTPIVIMARVARRHARAYLTEREESELVIDPWCIRSFRELRYDAMEELL